MRSILTLLTVGFMAVSSLASAVKQPNTPAGVIALTYQHSIDGQGGYLSDHLLTDVLKKNGIKSATAKKIQGLANHYISNYKRAIEINLAAQIDAKVLVHYKEPYEKHLDHILPLTTETIKTDLSKGLPALTHALQNVFKQNLKGNAKLLAALNAFLENFQTKRIPLFCEECDVAHFKNLASQIKAAEK